MRQEVLSQVSSLPKCLLAHFANVWLLPGVTSVVVEEGPLVLTDLSTVVVRAYVLRPFSLSQLMGDLDNFELETCETFVTLVPERHVKKLGYFWLLFITKEVR